MLPSIWATSSCCHCTGRLSRAIRRACLVRMRSVLGPAYGGPWCPLWGGQLGLRYGFGGAVGMTWPLQGGLLGLRCKLGGAVGVNCSVLRGDGGLYLEDLPYRLLLISLASTPIPAWVKWIWSGMYKLRRGLPLFWSNMASVEIAGASLVVASSSNPALK